MMITLDDVQKIAWLSRIRLSDEEKHAMKDNLSAILGWVEKLDQVDTTGIEPLSSMHIPEMVCRTDVCHHTPMAEVITQNAPEKELNMFTVPKVVE